MSQLDISVSFSQLFGLIICFYMFTHYIIVLLIQYWYNYKLRSLNELEFILKIEKIDNILFIKRILRL